MWCPSHSTSRSAATARDTAAGSPSSSADTASAARRRTADGAPSVASATAKRAQSDRASSASKSRCASTAAVRGRVSASWASIMSVVSLSRTSWRRMCSSPARMRLSSASASTPTLSASSRRDRAPVRPEHPRQGPLRIRPEEGEPHQQRRERPDPEVGGDPADVVQGELGGQEEPEESAEEDAHPGAEPARREAADVHRHGHRQDEVGQRQHVIGPDQQTENKPDQHQHRQEQRRQHLTARGGILDRERGHHRDDAGDQHRDEEHRVVLRRQHRCGRAANRQLHRAGQPDEQVGEPQSGDDAQHRLQCHPQLVQSWIGAGEPVDGVAHPGPGGASPGVVDQIAVGGFPHRNDLHIRGTAATAPAASERLRDMTLHANASCR